MVRRHTRSSRPEIYPTLLLFLVVDGAVAVAGAAARV
jgi:hypothetical protein